MDAHGGTSEPGPWPALLGWCVVRVEAIPTRRLFAPPRWRFVAAARDHPEVVVAGSAVFCAPAAEAFDRYAGAWRLIPGRTVAAERHLAALAAGLVAAGWAGTWVPTPFWYCRHFRPAAAPGGAGAAEHRAAALALFRAIGWSPQPPAAPPHRAGARRLRLPCWRLRGRAPPTRHAGGHGAG
jgi:hypothetical protein